MKQSEGPPASYPRLAMDSSTLQPPPSSVLSSHTSSTSSSKPSPSAISPCPSKPPFSQLLRKRKKGGPSQTWASRIFRLHKLSMEASADEGLLLPNDSDQGFHGNWGDGAEQPKRELRFAAKIAAAMDADGFIGVKDSVCADAAVVPVGCIKQLPVCVKNVGNIYCAPSPAANLNLHRAPLKQARPRRRKWRFLRRLRKTRLLFVDCSA